MTKKLQLMKRQKDLLTFVFVRHPFDRLESAYYDKVNKIKIYYYI